MGEVLEGGRGVGEVLEGGRGGGKGVGEVCREGGRETDLWLCPIIY